ncbi:hypothetical protein ACYULU_09125 [Breznakiellaceae bacterium SP9]
MSTDWLPTHREGQLNMANVWLSVISSHANWNVPTADADELALYATNAQNILAISLSADSTAATTAECHRLFAVLIEKMRFIKDRHYKSPPLVDENYISLLLKIPDHIRTLRGTPRAQRTAEIGRSGTAMLILHYKYAEGTESLADTHTDIRNQIRYGLLPPPGVEPSGSDLLKVPTTPEELPIVFASKRKKDFVYFTPNDSGKTCYFEIRISNDKDGYGPWCPLFHAIVP